MPDEQEYSPNGIFGIVLDALDFLAVVTNTLQTPVISTVEGRTTEIKPQDQVVVATGDVKELVNDVSPSNTPIQKSNGIILPDPPDYTPTASVPATSGSNPPEQDSDSIQSQGTVLPPPTLQIEPFGFTPEMAFTDAPTSISCHDSVYSFHLNDPVDPFTGSFSISETDIFIPGGAFDLELIRNYDSLALFAGPFGWNWDHNHNQFVRKLIMSPGIDDTYGRWTGKLHEDLFVKQPDGHFEPPPGVFEKFEIDGLTGDITITLPGKTVYLYHTIDSRHADRRLLDTITDPFGNVLQYTYTDNQLTSLTDNCSGRSLDFVYGNCGLLERVFDGYGRVWEYFHDPDIEHLALVKFPSCTDYPNGYTKAYDYSKDLLGDPKLSHAIVAAYDGDGNTYIQNEYDVDPSSFSYGRVISQLVGGQPYVYEYTQIQYVPQNPNLSDVQTLVTAVQMPDGGVHSYTFNYRGDLIEDRFRLTLDGSLTVLITSYEYDKYGNLVMINFPRANTSLLGPSLQFTYATDYTLYPDVRMRGKMLTSTYHADPLLPAPDPYDVGYRVLWKADYITTDYHDFQHIQYTYDPCPGNTLNPNDFRTEYTYSGGFLASVILPTVKLPNGTSQLATISFDASTVVPGRVWKIHSAKGKETDFNYGTTGESKSRLISIGVDIGGLGLIQNVAYSTAVAPIDRNFGRPVSSTDPSGFQKTFVFNSMGKLESVNLPSVGGLTGQIKIHYDADGFVIGVENPRGNYTDSVITDSFIKTIIVRDLQREVKSVTIGSNSAFPRTSKSEINFQRLPVRVLDPELTKVSRQYDERGLLLREQTSGIDGTTSPLIKRAYDHMGNMTRIYEAVRTGTTETAYNEIDFTYDRYQRLGTAHSVATGTSTVYTYGWVNPSSGINDWDNGVEAYNPLVRVDVLNGSGQVVSRTVQEYDKRGRLIRSRVAEFTGVLPGTVNYLLTKYFYDQDDNLYEIHGPRQAGGVDSEITLLVYDGANRVTKITDPEGNIRNYTYDGTGRTTSVDHQDVNGYAHLVTNYAYTDARKRLTKVTTPDGVSFGIDYDDRDLPIVRRLPVTYDDTTQRQVLASFGIMGEVLSQTIDPVTDPGGLGITSTWQYNKRNQLIQFTDPTGKVTSYTYDAIARPVGITYPSGATESFSYDSHSRLQQKLYGFGTFESYSYTENGLIAGITVSPGALLKPVPAQTFTYDSMNRLLTAVNSVVSVSRTYDSLGRMLSEQGSVLTSQSFDTVNGKTTRTFANGRAETYTLNLNGVPTLIQRTVAGTSPLGSGSIDLIKNVVLQGPDRLLTANQAGLKVSITAAYDEQTRLYQLTYVAGVGSTETIKYRYDSRSRRRVEVLTSTSAPATNNYALHALDTKDRLSATSHTLGPVTLTGTIDTQAQHDTDILTYVIPAEPGTPQLIYNYDKSDTRTLFSSSGTVVNYSSDSEHNLLATSTHPTDSFTYAAHGTRKTDGTRTFDVDGLGRIVKIADNGGSHQTLAIAYDALGRPVTLDNGTSVRTLCYFGMELVEELLAGTPNRQYTNHPLLGRISTHVTGDSIQNLYDARQNLIATVSTTGVLKEVMRYDEFGFPTVTTVGGSTGLEPVFGGMRSLNIPGTAASSPVPNWPSGPYLGMFRLYDPSNGVWMSQDPLGYVDSPNLSAYVAQCPIDMTDPIGLSRSPDATIPKPKHSITGASREPNDQDSVQLQKLSVALPPRLSIDPWPQNEVTPQITVSNGKTKWPQHKPHTSRASSPKRLNPEALRRLKLIPEMPDLSGHATLAIRPLHVDPQTHPVPNWLPYGAQFSPEYRFPGISRPLETIGKTPEFSIDQVLIWADDAYSNAGMRFNSTLGLVSKIPTFGVEAPPHSLAKTREADAKSGVQDQWESIEDIRKEITERVMNSFARVSLYELNRSERVAYYGWLARAKHFHIE